jgi:1,4-alpha-glucan branching enzyme
MAVKTRSRSSDNREIKNDAKFQDELEKRMQTINPAEITDFDIYLLSEGTHYESFEKLGAHLVTINGEAGVQFSTWAPNAHSLSVVGDFNGWNSDANPMHRVHNSSIWSCFIPGLKEGDIYKFAVTGPNNYTDMKTDPYAFSTEMRPKTASVVRNVRHFHWEDSDWINYRTHNNHDMSPISIYEVHLGSWKRSGTEANNGFLNYRDIAHQLTDHMKYMGYSHVEFLPIMEHPLDASWGYQVTNFYAPSSRFGSPEDFMYLVNHLHKNGIGVILDWVPSHFPKDMHGLNMFDGTQIYAYEDWRRGEHKEWGTLVFDYFRPEVRNFLISNALFWIEKYHVDGLRVDAVASMLYLDYSRNDGEWSTNMFGGREHLEAIDFIKSFNEVVHGRHKGVLTLAEESTAWTGVSHPTFQGGLGFDMKWNMGWMHDTLEYYSKEPIHRSHHQDNLTFSMIYAFSERFALPLSHDEVVHGKRSLLEKMPGDDWQKFANLRMLYGYMFTHPGKKLLFMGSDFAQRDEWNSAHSLDWHLCQYESHYKIMNTVRDLNHLYRNERALHGTDYNHKGFEWVDFSDAASSVLSYVRWSDDYQELLFIVINMTPVPRLDYRLGVPRQGFYKEIFNSDSEIYGGSNMGNGGGLHSEDIPTNGRPCSLNLNLPPLSTSVFKLQ